MAEIINATPFGGPYAPAFRQRGDKKLPEGALPRGGGTPPTPEKYEQYEQRGRSEEVRTDGRARLGRNVWEP